MLGGCIRYGGFSDNKSSTVLASKPISAAVLFLKVVQSHPIDKGIGGDTVIESPSFSPSISLMRNVRYRESFSNPQIRNRVGK